MQARRFFVAVHRILMDSNPFSCILRYGKEVSMNVVFHSMNAAYHTPVLTSPKRTAQAGKAKGDYDTVNIRSPRTAQDEESAFARMLARKAASQIRDGASPEQVQDLSRRIADGAYVPDAQKIAGRLLGLG